MQAIRATLLVLASILLVQCGPSTDAALEANKELVRQFAGTINAADFDGLDALLTEDFRRHSQATAEMPEMEGREAFKQLQQGFYASMPDQAVTLEHVIAEGDFVAAYGTYSGTHTGPLADFPITGEHASISMFTLFRIEGGRIAELWVEWDNLAFLSQLGLFPPPAPDSEAT